MFPEQHFNLKQMLHFLELKTVILGVVLLVLIRLLLSVRKKKLKLPPGPTGLPIVGYFPFIGKEPYKTFSELAKKYGNVFGFYLGQKYVVILNDWEADKDAFSKNATANRPPKLFEAVPKGLGIGGANGLEWLQQRRFVFKAMKDIGFGRTHWEQLVQEEVNDLLNVIEEHGPSPLDINQVFSSTFANNVMTLIFGQRLPMGHPDTKFVSKSVDLVMESVPSMAMINYMPWLTNILLKLGFVKTSVSQKDLLAFSEYITKEIERRLKSQNFGDGDAFVDEYFKEVKLNTEKKLNNTFTESSLQSNVQAIILGGSETSRNGTLWLLIAMAEHPEIQEKVHKELDCVLGKNGRIKWSERNKIPYTYAVIMESMRIHSIVPINTLRMTFEDIEVCGYDIPKGTILIANHWALHNDPKYWPSPEKFNPERFLMDDGKQINFKPESYVPFSYGKRSCPGELIALMEILSYFTMLMQKFTVLPKEGDHVKYSAHLGLTYQPRNVELRFILRD